MPGVTFADDAEPPALIRSITSLGPEPSVEQLFDTVDADKRGVIERSEFIQVTRHDRDRTRKLAESRAQVKFLKWLVIALLLAIVIVVSVNSAVTAGVVDAFKDTFAQKAGGDTEALTDGKNKILGTREQQEVLPLIVAPVLAKEVLRNVRIIDAKYFVAELNQYVEKIYHIATVSIVNLTALWFTTVEGDTIRVWNGDTFLETSDGARHDLCEAEASCAALVVEDAARADELKDQVRAHLSPPRYRALTPRPYC